MMTAATIQGVSDGIHDGMPRSVYEAWRDDAGHQLVHYSMLKLFAMPPAKAKQRLDRPPEPSAALDLGDAAHAAVFEPERFSSEFVRAIKVDRRTSAGKAEWRQFEDETAAGKTILAADDYDTAVALRDAIWTRDTQARSILASPGKVERSFVWRDEATGLTCKARADWMTRWQGWTVVLDLKTTDTASEYKFASSIAKYRYAEQAAFYLDGLDVLAKLPRRWLWLAIEKEPPYLTALYEPSPAMLSQARLVYRGWLDTLKTCRETGVWPGYHDGITTIDLPAWASGRNGD